MLVTVSSVCPLLVASIWPERSSDRTRSRTTSKSQPKGSLANSSVSSGSGFGWTSRAIANPAATAMAVVSTVRQRRRFCTPSFWPTFLPCLEVVSHSPSAASDASLTSFERCPAFFATSDSRTRCAASTSLSSSSDSSQRCFAFPAYSAPTA
jgi:hypothetical protein